MQPEQRPAVGSEWEDTLDEACGRRRPLLSFEDGKQIKEAICNAVLAGAIKVDGTRPVEEQMKKLTDALSNSFRAINRSSSRSALS